MHPSERNRIVPQILKDRNKESSIKVRGNSPYYGITDKESNMAVAIKFVAANGEQKAIHYHDIVSPIEYDGNSRIVLLTPRISILILGQNLNDLFDYIIQHRVQWIEEPQESFGALGNESLKVSEIRFEEAG